MKVGTGSPICFFPAPRLTSLSGKVSQIKHMFPDGLLEQIAPGGKPPGVFLFGPSKRRRTVAISPFPGRPRRLSLRYYLWDGHALSRVPHRLHSALLSGDTALPQYANSKQKVVEVLIWRGPGRARKIEARGTISFFNSKGYIDLREATEAMAIAVEGSKPKRRNENVLDIGPVIRSQRWSREHTWKPAPMLLRMIIADIEGQSRIP